ncbi:MAG: diguanylate cyclase [Thiomicrorhabdus chilensis]|uniref:putative bifunctional diguanylate cyclase/phosphodiesterase n=1 Tax=Thiomicrorhabdus chilensis TaxID=63656 RepID=UPI00299E2725|nr:diguanylate cyclase [Thiomicrorhabdus chilensis]MDX1347932.1 diguanylate cyclase [Thiomicrorhabdus chilensis]
MLELRKSDKHQQTKSVGMLLEDDRVRTSKMIARSEEENRADVKKMMGSLQKRFSHTADLPEEIAKMVEDQVQMRTRDLFRQANYDALTHLPNRTYFGETLETVLERAKAAGSEFSLLFLDLDGFKAINDTLGHHAGDELLQHVAARLVSSVREGDIVSRRGGDEFVILLTDLSSREDIVNICKRIINEVSRPYWLEQREANISTSIGVARYPLDGVTPSELMEHSDSALYVSKSSGRKTFRFYDEVMSVVPAQSHELQAELLDAIEQGRIQTCFEPQVELKSGQIVGASLTACWHNDHLETPYLNGWMELLVKSGQSRSVASWLLDSALYYLQQWQSQQSELVVSVPVLDSLWLHDDLVVMLDSRLQSMKLGREQLQLEFSLASLQSVDGKLKQTLIALGQAGYQITLTEVGAYPLDLALLSSLQLNEIKLDRAWLQTSMQSKSGQAWLQGLIQMAKSLDICVIASGLDSSDQVRQLREWGCLMGQGRVWSQPIEAQRFNAHLMARSRVGV